jgi:hypothetical protein
MRIDSGGNLLVGKTSADTTAVGVEARSVGLLVATRTSGQPIYANLRGDDGDVIGIAKDDVKIGSIQASGTNMVIGNNGDVCLNFVDGATDRVQPANTDRTSRDNAIDLGVSGARFKDLYLSGGVYLGGTGSANYLDDYEEGSFTPTYTASNSSPTSTYGIQSGFYVKVGKFVHVQVRIRTDAISGGSGTLRVVGFPFTNISDTQGYSSFSLGYVTGFSSTGHPSKGYLIPATTTFDLVKNNTSDPRDASSNTVQVSDMVNGSGRNDIIFAGTYMTND